MDRLADAVARLSQAVALVPVDSGDYDKADKELTSWKKELQNFISKAKAAKQAEKPAETLKVPEPLPTTTGGVVKDKNLAPPKAVVSPAAEATPTGVEPTQAKEISPTETP